MADDIPGLPYDGTTDVEDLSGNGKGVALNVWPSDNRVPTAIDPIPLDTFILAEGELAYALTSQRLRVGDGYTPGGDEVAFTADIDAIEHAHDAQIQAVYDAITGKANISGGNEFVGNQTINGNLIVYLDAYISGVLTANAVSVTDEPYSAAWAGNFSVPTKNALYNKFQSIAVSWGNITGTLSDQTDLQTALNGKAALVHSHTISDVTNLQTTLDGKAPLVHSHVIADVTGLQGELDNLDADKGNLLGGNTWSGTQTFSNNIVIPAEAYGSAWNGKQEAATKDAVYDKIETLGSISVSDEPYGGSWDGVTGAAPSKNAVYDKIEALSVGGGGVTTFNTRSGAVVLTAADVTAAMPAFTGDVTNPAGSVVNTIAPGVVTLAKQANVATGTVFYRKTAGSGSPEVQSLATLKTDLGLTGTNSGDQSSIVGITGTIAQFNTACTDADFSPVGHAHAAADITSGILSSARMPALTGDVTSVAGMSATTITNGAVTLAKIQSIANGTLLGRDVGSAGSPQVITLGTGLSMSGSILNASGGSTIVGITGTKAQFDTAVTDDNFAYIGQFNQFTSDQQIVKGSPNITLNPSSGSSSLSLLGTFNSSTNGLLLTTGGATVYFGADTTVFRNRGSTATYATIDSTGISVTGTMTASGAVYAGSTKRCYQQAVAAAGGEIYMSTSAPSGGADGDIWLQYA